VAIDDWRRGLVNAGEKMAESNQAAIFAAITKVTDYLKAAVKRI
jgi:hypothetical protein